MTVWSWHGWLNMQERCTICFTDLEKWRMVRHLTPDTEVVSGEFLFHHLERQSSFSREATSSSQGGSKAFFLEVKDNTTEKIVGNGSGVFTVQSIRRKSGDDKYNLEILQSVTGVPWDPQATRDDMFRKGPRPAIVAGEAAEPLAQPVVVQAPKPKTSRRLYITKRDLEKYGYTAGCPACDGVQIGRRSTGVHHNDICRERIEKCFRQEEDNPRVVRFEARQEEEATGLPQTVGVYQFQRYSMAIMGKRPYGLPDTCRVWAREDEDAINFKTTLAEGPEWKDVIWRVTRKKSNDQIISSRPIKDVREAVSGTCHYLRSKP